MLMNLPVFTKVSRNDYHVNRIKTVFLTEYHQIKTPALAGAGAGVLQSLALILPYIQEKSHIEEQNYLPGNSKQRGFYPYFIGKTYKNIFDIS